ncbi:T-cell surface glycoprotein CD1e, membrane-associated isoform X1 [Erinaceus europaeus]|uniref:T-cell surface glycoprotein CD1e, membrane-associated isoform X1 n=1 Tax=Erinaceus europaeus TaxID=9365 RepID=A0ABM3XXY8_ERIEU|nr:T-cell surface glycoprotein CD1e, membrane-associated isoform X1 [Erinaceus europaeus]
MESAQWVPLLLCHILGLLSAPHVLGHLLSTEESPSSFQVLQTSSFANRSQVCSEGSAWLDSLQTHAWDPALRSIHFLRPWSQGNFSKEELSHFQALLQLYFHTFPQAVQTFASQFQFQYPFELQVLAGCQLGAEGKAESFLKGAYQGSDLLSFQGHSWVPSPEAGRRAQDICKVLSYYMIIGETLQRFLEDTCPRFLAGLLKTGKSELEQQVKPEAWLSPGPPPGPGRLLLVCHISGFHPKPMWAMWMRGEQEQPGTRREDFLPQADGTWYLRVTLDVAAWEAAGLACRVRHSSLGGQDLLLHWDGYSVVLQILSCLTIIAALVMAVGVVLWFKRHSSNRRVFTVPVPHPAFPQEVHTQGPRRSGQPPYWPQESSLRNGLFKKMKIILDRFW